jgi:hypothetical protein
MEPYNGCHQHCYYNVNLSLNLVEFSAIPTVPCREILDTTTTTTTHQEIVFETVNIMGQSFHWEFFLQIQIEKNGGSSCGILRPISWRFINSTGVYVFPLGFYFVLLSLERVPC